MKKTAALCILLLLTLSLCAPGMGEEGDAAPRPGCLTEEQRESCLTAILMTAYRDDIDPVMYLLPRDGAEADEMPMVCLLGRAEKQAEEGAVYAAAYLLRDESFPGGFCLQDVQVISPAEGCVLGEYVRPEGWRLSDDLSVPEYAAECARKAGWEADACLYTGEKEEKCFLLCRGTGENGTDPAAQAFVRVSVTADGPEATVVQICDWTPRG